MLNLVIKLYLIIYICPHSRGIEKRDELEKSKIDEKIEVIKHFFKEKNISESKLTDGEIQKTPGNSFIVEFSQLISFSGKTAFITYVTGGLFSSFFRFG